MDRLGESENFGSETTGRKTSRFLTAGDALISVNFLMPDLFLTKLLRNLEEMSDSQNGLHGTLRVLRLVAKVCYTVTVLYIQSDSYELCY